MAIKHGQILTVGNSFVVDRIQTGGPTNLNIPQDKIYELGNFNAVGVIHDIPDLSYDLESVDVTTDGEALLLRRNPASIRGSRTDTVTTTTASAVVTDADAAVGDVGRPIDSATVGIPAGSYVGTVIAGVSFRISSSPTTQVDVTATASGTVPALLGGDRIDFGNSLPIDIISPFKAGQNLYNIVSGLVIPWLTLDTATYRFGQKANATQTFTVRGDSVFYIPGTPVYEEFPYSAPGVYTLTHTALDYVEEGVTQHVLAVCWVDAVSGTSGRLFYGIDYTDTATTFTLLAPTSIPSTARVCASYGTAAAGNYPQSVHTPAGLVKPAAIRSKDIDIYVGPQGGPLARWGSVQSFEATRKVNLQADEEFGNPHYVDQDYDTVDVTGNVVIRPRTPQELIKRVQDVTGETDPTKVVSALSTALVEVEARLRHPDTGTVLKTIHVPDARFVPPAVQGKVNQRHDITFPYTSEEGLAYVYKGLRVT